MCVYENITESKAYVIILVWHVGHRARGTAGTVGACT